MLLANLTQFVAPSYMAWTASGELIVMVMLGGIGTVFGRSLGALALLRARGSARRLDRRTGWSCSAC